LLEKKNHKTCVHVLKSMGFLYPMHGLFTFSHFVGNAANALG